ncbi:polyprenol monophosphomannose synthase [Halothermothrix orenii]|uniref:Glycosyl transferase family 2 n=1 Tax=Halothermothrix orenii (strain H 168 / OCM 544 / DSM 9562) TaxID=373903 RepID=B8CY79_HALOH|nr:polyprenol monophosphomannose synthase [Halothermothrix orenii]ACL70248.1 glycosyl transferase family 2 [Halothermothrix orenii H 168]
MKTLIIIPTYNERENIKDLLREVFNINEDIDILVVDDNSPDGTAELVKELKEQKYKTRLHLLVREGKLGLASAYITGFKWALKHNYQYIFEMDADFSHNPVYIPDFLEKLKNYDLVLGSRYVEGGGVKDWGLIRKIMSRGGSLYARLILNLPYHDLTGGFKGFRREVLEAIDLDSVKSEGYSFQIEMTYRAHLKGFNIKETPIIFEDRTLGKSKMSKKIFMEAVFMVWWLRFHKRQLMA